MKLNAWYKKRGMRFILERARRLKERYGISPRTSIGRIERCMDALQAYGCFPTFAVPGMVVERNLRFIQRLQEAGAEIAVHGYNHVDLKSYPPEGASRQLQHAVEVFRASGLEAHGFRCPYLSATDDLIKALPPGLFEYSSNQAIQWPICPPSDQPENLLFETINRFYAPARSETALCLPCFHDGLVEIPVCVPDDLQLHDGLGYGLEQVSRVWLDILRKTHHRGEVFNLMFHPELASFCEAPFLKVLQEAKLLQPAVWFARLREVCAWWMEKSTFRVETGYTDNGSTLIFHCTPRATILCKGFYPKAPASRWDGDYWRLETRQLNIDTPVLPFIGIPPGVPQWITTSLQGMGYILGTGETAYRCSLVFDEISLGRFGNPVDLITEI